MSHRSYLYVPADNSGRLEKALQRGADALIVDLEDSVLEKDKDAARRNVRDFLYRHPQPSIPIWVRLNPGRDRPLDLEATVDMMGVTGYVPAKVDSAANLEHLDQQLTAFNSEHAVAPLIESAAGIINAREIATAPRVTEIHLGEVDLAADVLLRPTVDELELLYARSHVVHVSRAMGLRPPVAPVSTNVSDLTKYESTTQRLRSMGFQGRACIHPNQVTIANRVYTPTGSEISWARDTLAAFTAGGNGAVKDANGEMIDEAVLIRARRILQNPASSPTTGRHDAD